MFVMTSKAFLCDYILFWMEIDCSPMMFKMFMNLICLPTANPEILHHHITNDRVLILRCWNASIELKKSKWKLKKNLCCGWISTFVCQSSLFASPKFIAMHLDVHHVHGHPLGMILLRNNNHRCSENMQTHIVVTIFVSLGKTRLVRCDFIGLSPIQMTNQLWELAQVSNDYCLLLRKS